MRKCFTVLALVVFAGCGWNWPPVPNPQPTPTPTPTPPPVEECLPDLPWCHDVGQTCGECKHNPTQDPDHCEKAPECPPPPPPEPPPFDLEACEAKYDSGICLDGSPGMRVGWYQGIKKPGHPDVCIGGTCMADATPIVRNCDRCKAYGWTDGRCGCATVPEGYQPEEARYESEVELMGGETFVCKTTGDLEVDRPGGWFCRVVKGKNGKLQACFPNGKACSPWITVEK